MLIAEHVLGSFCVDFIVYELTSCLSSGVDTTVNMTNNISGIEAMCPSSKEDFVAFEKLLKEKITQFEKSVHYSNFLESLFRELCISCKS